MPDRVHHGARSLAVAAPGVLSHLPRISIIAASMLLPVCLLLADPLAAAPPADFVVSPTGDDGNPGTAAKPFATVGRARDAVRAKIAKGMKADITVRLRGGTYRITEPIVFGPNDSGTEKHSITYAAWPGERPVISGAKVILGWKKDGDGSFTVALPDEKAPLWPFTELFVNGVRRPKARHPNGRYARVGKVIDDRRSFQFAAGDVPALTKLGLLELVLLHDWSISRTPVASIDAKAHTLTTAREVGGPAAFWRINGFEKNPRYFLENHPALLDAPGEWFLDTASGILTYRPLPGETIGSVEVVTPVAKQLLVVRGDAKAAKLVRNLHFAGLTFEHCAWRPAGVRYAGGQACFHWTNPQQKGWGWEPVTPAIRLEAALACRLTHCTVRRVGGSGIWIGKGSRDCAIDRCAVTDVAGNGVMVGEAEILTGAELPGANTVTDCLIERCGVSYHGAVGVWVGLSGENVIAHNEIRHHPYTGVSVGWRWNPTPSPCKANRVEHNHIHHVMQILSDGGGIYTLGRQPGTVLRGNWIHDVPLNAGRAESNGMFLDEGTTDMVIENNLIHDIARSPLRFHKAGRNLVRNNHWAPGKDIPLVRYNATDPKNITLQDNTAIPPEKQSGEEFRKAVANAKATAGIRGE